MREEIESYIKMREEFYRKYTGKIIPLVRRYENSRKTKLVIAIILSVSLACIASFLMYLALTSPDTSSKSDEGIMKFSLMIYCLSYFSWYWIKKSFENSIKEKIMPTICGCFGDMSWSHDLYNGGEIFSSSRVVSDFTSESYDDIFTGSYKDVGIEIIESEFEIGSGKNRRTVFKGVIVKLEMNKSFTGHTVIKPNSLIHIPPSSDLHFTELEDVEFNKKYDVYTNDEVDARYLITPSFMERLKNMKTAFCAKNFNCAFYGNLLIVALPTRRDLFSLCSLIKPMDDNRQYFRMYEEIVSIVKLIDHFKLTQKLGL